MTFAYKGSQCGGRNGGKNSSSQKTCAWAGWALQNVTKNWHDEILLVHVM